MRQMKDSGIEWIGDIPNDWHLNLVKNIFNIARGRVIAKTEVEPEKNNFNYPVYSSQTKNNGCLGYISSYDFDCESLTWTTDGANAGAVFHRAGKYNVTNVCGILLPQSNSNIISFLKYMLGISTENSRRKDINGYKIMSNEMAQIPLVLPPKQIQISIASFLDVKCAKIDGLIVHEEATIEELKAYKQSVITEAVTKGLDKSVPMKDSGVKWIGKIPETWEMNRIKFISTYNDEAISDKTDPNTELNYVDIGSVSFENGIEKIEKYKFKTAPSRARRIARKGDIIISTVRTYLKAITIVDNDDLIVSTGFCVLRPQKAINKYVEYFCKSSFFTDNVARYSVGISYPAINAPDLIGLVICQPPQEEQQQIAVYLDKKCANIDNLIATKQQKIEELKEYKKSLIYEYVTGKKVVA